MDAPATTQPHDDPRHSPNPKSTQSPPLSESTDPPNSIAIQPQSDAPSIPDQQTDAHHSGTHPPEPILLTDDAETKRRANKRKKFTTRKTYKRKRPSKKVQTLTDSLTDNLNPIPFVPLKKLDLDTHEEVLKRLGLYEFSKIEFDRCVRTDMLVELIANYDPKKRCSYVKDCRINVNRADLARALKLPAAKQDKGSSSVEEVDLDSEVFDDEAIGFIEDFVCNWMLLHESSAEIANWTRCVRDGHPEKLDSASLIWYKVEKELIQGDKLVDCYYASHLQYLIRSQKESLFVEGDDCDDEENGKVDEEKEEQEQIEEKDETEVKTEKEQEQEQEHEQEQEQEQEEQKENVSAVQEQKEKESTVFTVEEQSIEEIESTVSAVEEQKEKESTVFAVEEQSIELTLGADVEETTQEEAEKEDETMVDAEEKEEIQEMEEQGSFLQRCQSSDLNNFEEIKVEDVEVEDEQIEQVEDEDEDQDQDEGFDLDANDDSFDRDGLTGNFLQGVETSHNPYSSHGMSSMDLFGSRAGPIMSPGGPSFYNNGGKRVIEQEEPEEHMHHLDQKRLKTDDLSYCFEQMHDWMQKAKMIQESKERSYEDVQYNQQMEIGHLQERQQLMEMVMKSKDEELAKKHAEVFRLERELFLMTDLLSGYRKALEDTRCKFSEYRKRAALQEESLYKDAGPGGLVLSTREIEKQRLKQEEDMLNLRLLAKNFEEDCVYQFDLQNERLLPMVDKLASFENEVQRLKDLVSQRKETREPSAELALPAELAETGPVESEENQKSLDEIGSSVEPEEDQKVEDEIPEKDADMESVPIDADESEGKGGGEEH